MFVWLSPRGVVVAPHPDTALLCALLELLGVRLQYEDVDDNGPVLRYMTVEVRLNESVFMFYEQGTLPIVAKARNIGRTS